MVRELLRKLSPVRLVNAVRLRPRSPRLGELNSILEAPHWDQSAEPDVFRFALDVARSRTPADKLHDFVVACAYPHDSPIMQGESNTWRFYARTWKELRKKLPRYGLGIKSEEPVAGKQFVHVELKPHPGLLKYLASYKLPARFEYQRPA